jgi:VRR-NUC domain
VGLEIKLGLSRQVVRAGRLGNRTSWLEDPKGASTTPMLIETVVLKRWKKLASPSGYQSGGARLNPKLWIHLYELLGAPVGQWRKYSVTQIEDRLTSHRAKYPDALLRLPKQPFVIWLLLRCCSSAYLAEVVEAYQRAASDGLPSTGVPDLFLYRWTGARLTGAHFVEVKAPGDQRSRSQTMEIERLRAHRISAGYFKLIERKARSVTTSR